MSYARTLKEAFSLIQNKKVFKVLWLWCLFAFSTGCLPQPNSFFSSWCPPDSPCTVFYSDGPTVRTFTINSSVSISAASSTGAAPTSYSISPSTLPPGLTFDSATGAISGTATSLSPLTEYVVTGSNSKGSASTIISLAIVDLPPTNLSYSANPATYNEDTAIVSNVPSSSGGPVTEYSVTPTLPAGLYLNSSTGVISGTPLLPSPPTDYTITASNSGGSTSAIVRLQVLGGASQLVFLTQPVSSVAGQPVGAVILARMDFFGNIVGGQDPITIALADNPWGASLSGTLTLPALNGIAIFSDALLIKSGTGYRITATTGNGAQAVSTTSNTFSVAPNVPTHLAFHSHLPSTAAGASISPYVQVAVQDQYGNTATSTSVTIAVGIGTNPHGASLFGVTSQTTILGVAHFSSLSLRKAGSGYTLTASSPGLTSAESSAFTITPASPSNLTFLQQPTSALSETNISPTIQVQVLDSFNNLVSGSTIPVSLGIGTNPNSGTLAGTTTVNANAGVAIFSDVRIDRAGVGYTLVASSSGLTSTTSSAFTISPGPAAKLAFTQQPSQATSQAAFSPAVQVTVQDNAGNTISSATNSVTISIGNNPSSSTLSGTATVSASSGIASFSGLSLDKVGVGYTLQASAAGLQSATSSAFNITPGSPSKLSFSTGPSDAVSQTALAPAVRVVVQDAAGNTVTSATNPVSLTIGTNPSSGILGGTTSVAASSGQSTFSNLTVDKMGSGYTLVASSPGLTSATSTAFQIFRGAASRLAFGVSPGTTTSTVAISPAITVRVEDLGGNLIDDSTAAISVAIGTNPAAGVLSGTSARSAVGGIASFPGMSIDKSASGYTLVASSSGLSSATSSAFTISPGAATQMVFLQQPTFSTAGVSFSPAVRVALLDAIGNTVTSSSASVSLAILANPASGTLSGTTAVNAVSGVSTFSNLKINRTGSGYTLRASSSGLPSVDSDAFDISTGVASRLAFVTQPGNTVSGEAVSPAVSVQVTDSEGNIIQNSTAQITLAIGTNPAAGVLSGTKIRNASAGLASYNDLSIDKSGTGYTLTASSTGLTGATSSTFNISPKPPAQLAFKIQPSSTATSNVAFATQPQVEIQDILGNLTPTTETITLAAFTDSLCQTPAPGSLQATANPINTTTGSASFSAVRYTTSTNQTIYLKATASSTGWTACSSEVLVLGPATKLSFSTQPSSAVSSAAIFATQPVVQIRNDSNSLMTQATNTISLSAFTNPTCTTAALGTLSASMAAVSGVATFTGVQYIGPPGTIYLRASASGLSSDCSTALIVSQGAPANLAYSGPSNLNLGSTSAVEVRIQDSWGTTLVGNSSAISLSLFHNSACTLSLGGGVAGTSATAVDGLASFPSFQLTRPGTFYVRATSGVLQSSCNAITADPVTVSFTSPTRNFIRTGAASSQTMSLSLSQTVNTATQISFQVLGSSTGTSLTNLSSTGTVTIPANSTTANISFDLSAISGAAGPPPWIGLAITGTSNGILSGTNGQLFASLTNPNAWPSTLWSSSGGNGSTQHSCVIDQSGALYCWGANSSGQVGNNSTNSFIPIPTRIDSPQLYSRVTLGASHTCGILAAGSPLGAGLVRCWGRNTDNQLGDGTTTERRSPVSVDFGNTYSEITAGSNHTCAIRSGGSLLCWGWNQNGQQGDGTIGANNTVPQLVFGSDTFQSVAAGHIHTCGITSSGALVCWGSNQNGRLGNGTGTGSNFAVPIPIDSGTLYSKISLGAGHSCGLTTTGVLKCWGFNSSGQLGDGSLSQSITPKVIDATSTYSSVATSANFTCGITGAGELKCWGENSSGQLGSGGLANSSNPVLVGSSYSQVAVGGAHTCGLTSANELRCWGHNGVSQLSDGRRPSLLQPQSHSMSFSTLWGPSGGGGGRHSCAIQSDGALYCWGLNTLGPIGDGTTQSRPTAVLIDPGTAYSKVSLGANHTCGITTSGSLKCWGLNSSGQLGDDSFLAKASPVVIDSGTTYTAISAGADHTCGITTAGALKCWGNNSSGQVGDGSSVTRNSPTVINSGTSYSAIAAGANHTCGIQTSGSALVCWGLNDSGQVGDGTTTTRTSPVAVNAGTAYSAIAAGANHTCGIRTSGSALVCWGLNDSSQVGDGTTTTRTSPVAINAGTAYSAITAGANHTCGIRTSGSALVCWGLNNFGQLGDGNTANRSSPAVINSGTGYAALAANNAHTCGITTGGVFSCWGADDVTNGAAGFGFSPALLPRTIWSPVGF